ncbi:MAG: LON peptidase substrate-binding domain-containing protein [Sporichthyaceae bacterium]
MTVRLPLFPLGTVLFPGVPLPLHIFEPRYRQLISDLTSDGDHDDAEPPAFGVIAIREGWEVGEEAVNALFEVGCTAVLQRVESLPDGRFNVLAAGRDRFRLRHLDRSGPYLVGEVEYLAEDGGADAARVASGTRTAFLRYVDELLAQAEGAPAPPANLPDDPIVLSYLVAASMVLDVTDRQSLLEAPDAAARLRVASALLARERSILARLPSVPGTALTRGPTSLN